MKEFNSFVADEKPTPELLDVFAAGASLKVEHYEIAAYKSLIQLAQQAGLSDAVSLLKQNLSEEQETAAKLEILAVRLGGRVYRHRSPTNTLLPPPQRAHVTLAQVAVVRRQASSERS